MAATSWEGILSILPSEFPDALANNCPPRPGVLQTARAFRDNPALFSNPSKKRIEDIEQQIKVLQGEKEKLADEGSTRAAVAEACATICAPVRRLPSDVLHGIAHHALAGHPSPTTNHAPMNLSQVSSAWRSVVLHSPHLWTDLYLRVKSARRHSLVKYAQAINAWFRRAGSLPINIFLYVDCTIESGTSSAYNFRLLLKAIAPWTPRVARLGIEGINWINLMTQFVDIEWDLPNLHTLEILGQCASDEDLIDADIAKLDAVAQRITLFRDSSQITTLIANQEITRYWSTFSFLPWPTLTSAILKERLSYQEDLQKVLSMCSSLQSAFLSWIPDGSDITTQQPTVIDKLERLTLEIRPWDWNAVPRFFSAFVFLNLTHLEIRVEDILADPRDEILPFGTIASFPALRILHLDSGFPIPHIIDFLRSMPKLRILVLEFSVSTNELDRLFDALITSNNQGKFLPLLETLFIYILSGPILLDVLMPSRFICSRAQDSQFNCVSLKEFSLAGNICFLTDLHEEVARMSGTTKPTVAINIIPQSSEINSRALREVQHPHSCFANTEGVLNSYANLVGHVFWLVC